MNTKKLLRRGFTMVELLMVVAIMGIVSLVVVQNFDASESTAKDSVGDFNKSAVEKAIIDFHSIHGVYPSGFHTGLDADAATASVAGLSQVVALNLASDGTSGEALSAGDITPGYSSGNTVAVLGANVVALTAGQQEALRNTGIHRFASAGHTTLGEKGNQAPLDNAGLVCWALTGGVDLYRGGSLNFDGSGTLGTEAVTINGRALSTWQFGDEAVVLVFVTHDVDWGSALKADPSATGWGTMDGKAKVGLSNAVKDPSASPESTYPYYLAAFYISPSQVGSEMGYSCRLLGVLDAELNPVND